MKRIRYSKEGEILTSKQSFVTKEGTFQVRIYTTGLTFTLIYPESHTVHYVGGSGSKTLTEVKKLAKAKLVHLGVDFESETRVHHETIEVELPEELHYPRA